MVQTGHEMWFYLYTVSDERDNVHTDRCPNITFEMKDLVNSKNKLDSKVVLYICHPGEESRRIDRKIDR